MKLVLIYHIIFAILAFFGWMGFIFLKTPIVLPIIFNVCQAFFLLWLVFYDKIDKFIDDTYFKN